MKPVIRQLNAQEQEYYEKSLYPLQDEVLDLFTEERFYLTGGTCLSRFYFKHRYSEDLDFFFDGTLYSVNQFEIDYLKLVSKIKASNEIEITVAGEHFKRLFIKKKEGMIHHSDRGIQYCSNDYTKLLHKNRIKISMAEKGNPYENAIAERVNGILKIEFLLEQCFRTKQEARVSVKEAIKIYNEERLHMSLGYLTPVEKYEGKKAA